MIKGYNCKLLEIDLTERKTKERHISEDTLKKYIGGTGLGAWILFEELNPHTDPLGPDNMLMFITGPFAGARVPCSDRTSIVTKSPLTGIWAESDVGGKFGGHLKKSGFDGIIIRGRALRSSYILINETGAEIREADHIWGKDTYATHEILRQEINFQISTMSVGPAGEKKVLLSSIVSDGKDARIAARCGVGAVMGAKHLKAIAVEKGSKKIEVYDEEKLNQSVKETVKLMVSLTKEMKAYGTSSGVEACHDLEDFPIKNWRLRRWPEVSNLSGRNLADTVLKGRYHCGKCPIGCGRIVQVDEGKYKTQVRAGGPEYETMGSLGGNVMVYNIEAVTKANDLCNRYGMDTISVGQVIGFAFEAYEKNYIDQRDTGGIPLEWGSGEALIHLITLIGERRGIGEILGKGVKRACMQLAHGDPELSIEIKGLELPSHDPRAFSSLAIGYATSPRGACHLQAYSHGLEAWMTMPELGFPEILDRFSPERKAEMTAKMQNLMSLFDSLKICKFVLYAGVEVKTLINWLNAVTGWNYDMDRFMETGERIFNLKVSFNRREGASPADDRLPARFLAGATGKNFEIMMKDYYKVRGWTKDGVPAGKP